MKKIIDEKGRLFGKLSIIDLGLILILLIFIVGIYVKFFVLEQTSLTTETVEINYTLEINGVRDWTVNNIRIGDTLYYSDTEIGTVTSVSTVPYVVTSTTIVGELWEAEVPNRYTVYVEVEASGTELDGHYMVSRTVEMSVGNSSKAISTKYAAFTATVKEISVNG